MPPDLHSLVPRHKHDLEAARAVTRLRFPEIEPIVPALLEWLQDSNWPVAGVLAPHLAAIGEPLAPYIRSVLRGSDGGWKYSLIHSVVRQSYPLCESLAGELQRLAASPTENDELEEVHLAAAEALKERTA